MHEVVVAIPRSCIEKERTIPLRFVRNVFIHDAAVEGESWFHNRSANEVAICNMINVLDACGTYSDTLVVRRRAAKTSNMLLGGNRRDVVKYVAKRLPCTCLKTLHSAARKKVAKVGTCLGCLRQFPRSQMYVCTGCRYTNYCSRSAKGPTGRITSKAAVALKR